MGKFKDLTGMRFGRLTVIDRAPNQGKRTMWNCKCDCGNATVVRASHLAGGKINSCGCYRDELIGNVNKSHGEANTKLYGVWSAMKSRCNNMNDRHYTDYGGRGISVYAEWSHDFTVFRQWAYDNGYNENANRGECTIDRIDVDGNYCPENCRWVNQATQTGNRRCSPQYTYNGKTCSLGEWAREFKIPYKILWQRINRGMSFETAITR